MMSWDNFDKATFLDAQYRIMDDLEVIDKSLSGLSDRLSDCVEYLERIADTLEDIRDQKAGG